MQQIIEHFHTNSLVDLFRSFSCSSTRAKFVEKWTEKKNIGKYSLPHLQFRFIFFILFCIRAKNEARKRKCKINMNALNHDTCVRLIWFHFLFLFCCFSLRFVSAESGEYRRKCKRLKAKEQTWFVNKRACVCATERMRKEKKHRS